MSKIADVIKERVNNLSSLIQSSDIENLSTIFQTLSNEYERRILQPNESVDNIKILLTYLFASFLSYRDEVLVLIQGAVHRAHHVNNKYLSKFKHSRDKQTSSGTEARFYHRIPHKYLSGCSVDGIRFDTMELKSNKIYDLLDLVDNYKTTIDESAKDLIGIFEGVLSRIARALRWKLILYSESLSNYCGEVVTFEITTTIPASASLSSSSSSSSSSSVSSQLPPSKFTLDRTTESVQKILSKQTTSQQALSRVIFEVESAATAPAKKLISLQSDKTRSSAVIQDEDETQEAQNRKRNREEMQRLEQERIKTNFAMSTDQKIDDVKRQHQASLELLSDPSVDLARRELAAGNCNYRPDAPINSNFAAYDDEDEVEEDDYMGQWNVVTSKSLNNTQTSLLPSQAQSQSFGPSSQSHPTESKLLAPAKRVVPNVFGVPEIATTTIRLLINTQPSYLLRCKNRPTQILLPTSINIDFQWCTMGDEKLKSSVLQVPVSCVLQYARAELMKLTVFRQSPHFAKYTADSTSTTSSSSSSTVATVCSCACCHAFAVPIAIKRIKFEQLLLIGDSLFLRPFSQEGKVRTFELVCAQESPLTPAYSYLYQVTSRATLLAIHCHDLWLDQNTEDLIEDTDKEMSNQITLMEATVEELSQQLDGCYRAYNQIILSHSPVKSTSVGIQAIPVPCVYDISHFYTLEGITHMSSSATTATSTYTPTALVKTLQSDGVFPQLTECVALIACSTDDSISKDIYLESPAWTQDSQLVL